MRKPSHESFGFDDTKDSSGLADILLLRRGELAGRLGELGGVDMMRAYSELTDALIRRVFDLGVEESEKEFAGVRRKATRHIAIGAVGGYGRCEMSPFSDVDVVFLLDGEEDPEVELVIKRAFRILMDVTDRAGISVGYSYRRADEVEHLSLENQTALLDARCVAGSTAVYNGFCVSLRQCINPAAFVVGHVDARCKPNGFGSTPFVVEPDIKEGAGGLRDLHAARWIAQIAMGFSSENVWNGLRSMGILLDDEVSAMGEALEFLCRTRNTLHLLAGRGLDVLSTERQWQVAEAMGFSDVREFVSLYYTHASRIWRVYRKVAGACALVDLVIEPGMVARDGRLCILDRGLLARDGVALVRLFQHAQSYHLRIDREASDLITAAAQTCEVTPEVGRWFLAMLERPGVAESVRAMADTGVLQAIIPEFGDLMYLVPGDAAHQYTVGEHSLRAVEHLEALLSEHNEQFTDIFSRVQQLDVLFLSTLLHDIGKLEGKGNHAKSGALLAARFAAKLGMSDEACARVEFLVRHHLVMSETARLRDLHQKKTVSDFAAIVREPELLDMLLLLTVADSRAVGTVNWTQVQIRFLLELHDRTRAALRSPDSPGPDIDRHRTRVRRELVLANLPADEVDEHCASMPASYLLNTPPEVLAAHIGYVRTARGGSPAVEIKDDRAGEFTELSVVAMDRTGLLSDITAVLYAMGIDVHAAQIFTRQSTDHIAIDMLFIDFEGRQLSEMKKWQLEGDLLKVLNGELSIPDLLARWGKKPMKAKDDMRVRVLENLLEHQTVIEVSADDTPGLLYHLTRKMAELGWDIHSARVATWGHEAQDAFYVTDRTGEKLTKEQARKIADP